MTERGAFNTAVHRYLDGDSAQQLSAEEQERADRFGNAVREYAGGLATPGPELDRAVMQRVLALRAPARRKAYLRWFIEPQSVRIRPAVAALAAAVVILAFLLALPEVPVTPEARVAVVEETPGQTVLVRFELRAPGAREVALAGSFNGWDAPGIPLIQVPGSDVWAVTVPLTVGEHQYGFVVDGGVWIPDPGAHAQVDDGFGQTNSVLVVSPRGVVRS